MKKNTCFAPGVTLGVPFFTEAKAISSGSLHWPPVTRTCWTRFLMLESNLGWLHPRRFSDLSCTKIGTESASLCDKSVISHHFASFHIISPWFLHFSVISVFLSPFRANGERMSHFGHQFTGLGWGGNKGIFSNLAGLPNDTRRPAKWVMFRYVFRYLQNDVVKWVRHIETFNVWSICRANWAGKYSWSVQHFGVLWCSIWTHIDSGGRTLQNQTSEQVSNQYPLVIKHGNWKSSTWCFNGKMIHGGFSSKP